MKMQSLVRLAFPPQCIGCGDLVDEEFGLCGPCWRETPFITGLSCDVCGIPLIGEDLGHEEHCDDCKVLARPWTKGRAIMLYKDNGRKLVLSLKHGDRLELARPMADWMAAACQDLLSEDTVLVPVPAHPWRLLSRRYNQAAVLGNRLAQVLGCPIIPDLLRRTRRTLVQDGMSRDARFANLSEAIAAHKSAGQRLNGRAVLLVDDVMTSGATLAAAADACQAAGACRVDILVLARVAKDT